MDCTIKMTDLRKSIQFRCSGKTFKEFALPYLLEHSPNTELNYLFIDGHNRVFEHVIGYPDRVQSLPLVNYTKVCIYGYTNKLVGEIVDKLIRKNYRDYEELSDAQIFKLKSENRCKISEESMMAAHHPGQLETLLEAGMELDDN
jgi:hypothetical protein